MFVLATKKVRKRKGCLCAPQPSSSVQAAGPGDTQGFLPTPTTKSHTALLPGRAHGGPRAHPAHRPTRKPVGPAEPEPERVQRQGVDEVHEEVDQALHSHHQKPELQ